MATLASRAVQVLRPQQELGLSCQALAVTLSAWMLGGSAVGWPGCGCSVLQTSSAQLCYHNLEQELNALLSVWQRYKILKDSQTCNKLCLKVLPLEFYIQEL